MTNSDSGKPREGPAKASLAELLRSAGARPAPSEAAKERAKAAVYQAYVGELQHRSRRRWLLGIAASVAALIVAGLLVQQRAPTPVVAAHVTRVLGDRATVGTVTAAPAQPVLTRETVWVPPGTRLLLTLTNGFGVRVDQSSRLIFESPARLRLEQGAVYVETPRVSSSGSSADFVVQTAYGAVQHVGTRFEVRVASDELRVRVRDGTAVFHGASGKDTTVNAGEQLNYRAGIVTVVPGPGPASDAWGWAELVRPEYPIDGRSLAEVLAWLAHEAGMQLEFTDEASRTRAAEITLRGDVGTLLPRESIQAVLAGTDVPYVIEGTRLLIGPH